MPILFHELKTIITITNGNTEKSLASFQDIAKIFDFYLNNSPVSNQSQRIPMTEILSDQRYTFENLMAVHFHARASVEPVYLFKFDFEGSFTFAHEFEETEHDYGGVAHHDDVRYRFRSSIN